jgi:signal transduction histidine kinase
MPPSSDERGPSVDAREVLDRMGDGFFALDADWRITYANERGREIIAAAAAASEPDVDPVEAVATATFDPVGRSLEELVPDLAGTRFYEEYRTAMATGEPTSFEARFAPLDAWFEVRAFPADDGLSVYFHDVTARETVAREHRESLAALQRLYAISSDRERGFEAKLDAMFDVGREYLDLPNAFLTRIEGDVQTIEAAAADHPLLVAGESCPLEEAYCGRTVENDAVLTVVDAAAEGWADEPAYDRFELGTYVGGRVEVDGELHGTLCFADTEPRGEPFGDARRAFVELLTRWVSYELERGRARERIERERDRLDEFAGVVSHDLRTPLATAQGQLEIARAAIEDDAGAADDALGAVDRMLDRMDHLIDDLLTLAREGDRVDADEIGPVELEAVVAAAWAATEPEIGAGTATLSVDLDGATVRADEPRLRRLIENLLRNAVEHGGKTVVVGRLDDRDGFYVADDGPGFDGVDPDAVFEPGHTTDESGTGLGLAIVAGIAQAHGWTVTATESAAGGARFEVAGVTPTEP